MACSVLQNLAKIFPGGIRALDDLTLEAADGDRVVLAGPSGSGKTTALRLIAGLEYPSGGTVAIDGRIVNHLPPQHRDVAMVFQHLSLYPHLSVFGNLAFGLKLRALDKTEIKRRVAEAAAVLGIADLLKRKPGRFPAGNCSAWPWAGQWSAGLKSCSSTSRFRISTPPCANKCAAKSSACNEECLHTTMIYVTHDQTEAMTIGRRIAVLNGGKLQQIADPDTLYRRPANRFVASQIGSPAMNFFPGKIIDHGDELAFQAENPNKSPLPLGGSPTMSPLPTNLRSVPGEGQGEGAGSADSNRSFSWPVSPFWKPILQPYRRKQIILGIRPEHLHLEQTAAGEDSLKIPAILDAIESLGAESHLHLRSGPLPFICRTQSNPGAARATP